MSVSRSPQSIDDAMLYKDISSTTGQKLLNRIRRIVFFYLLHSTIPPTFPHWPNTETTVYPKKYAHGFCFAVLCCGYTFTDFPISIRLTSLTLWQSNDCPSASKATLMNMDKYFMWNHYEPLHNHNKAKHNKTVCIFLGIYCTRNGMNRLWRIRVQTLCSDDC